MPSHLLSVSETTIKHEIFLDNNSTTKPYDIVIKTMAKVGEHFYGNPSTSYKIGKSAKDIIEESRTVIARLLGIKNPCHLIFTSGASESNNTMIRGCILQCKNKNASVRKPKILCSSIEHSCVYDTCIDLQKQDLCSVEFIPVDNNGFIIENKYIEMIDANTKMVCIMIANNEIGTIQNIRKLVKILRTKNKDCFFLCDATQYVGKYNLDLEKLGIDGASFSGHKFHGPRGIGGMYLREPKQIVSCNTGGKQEYNLRAGTENTSSIFGMALALEVSCKNINKNVEKIWNIRNYMEDRFLKEILGCRINNSSRNIDERMYSVISITLPKKIDGLLKKLNALNIFVNVGSACNKGIKSRVLSAIGLENNKVEQTLRISLSCFNTKKDCKFAVDKIVELCNT
jgi:cysteine desulfurase